MFLLIRYFVYEFNSKNRQFRPRAQASHERQSIHFQKVKGASIFFCIASLVVGHHSWSKAGGWPPFLEQGWWLATIPAASLVAGHHSWNKAGGWLPFLRQGWWLATIPGSRLVVGYHSCGKAGGWPPFLRRSQRLSRHDVSVVNDYAYMVSA